MTEQKKSELEKLCRDFSAEFDGILTWKWDDFFGAVMAEFSIDDKDKVRGLLKKHMPKTYGTFNIHSAPEIVGLVKDSLGSLRDKQMLLSSDPEEDACLLCAWWPWGNGEKISIRIIPTCRRISDEDVKELKSVFKNWFGL